MDTAGNGERAATAMFDHIERCYQIKRTIAVGQLLGCAQAHVRQSSLTAKLKCIG